MTSEQREAAVNAAAHAMWDDDHRGPGQACPICAGRGTVPPDFYECLGMGTSTARGQCRRCVGTGTIVIPVAVPPPAEPPSACPTCKGMGTHVPTFAATPPLERCPDCNGTGIDGGTA